jgi:hypothetical protein
VRCYCTPYRPPPAGAVRIPGRLVPQLPPCRRLQVLSVDSPVSSPNCTTATANPPPPPERCKHHDPGLHVLSVPPSLPSEPSAPWLRRPIPDRGQHGGFCRFEDEARPDSQFCKFFTSLTFPLLRRVLLSLEEEARTNPISDSHANPVLAPIHSCILLLIQDSSTVAPCV